MKGCSCQSRDTEANQCHQQGWRGNGVRRPQYYLRVVRVTLAATRGVEGVGRRTEEGALVYDALVLGKDLRVPPPAEVDARAANGHGWEGGSRK